MLYQDDEVVWVPPIRYFDTPMPPMGKCRVLGDQKADSRFNHEHKSLLVYSEEYGHSVYVGLPVFYVKENAEKYSQCMAEIWKTIGMDEAHQLVDRILTENEQKDTENV